MKYGGFIPLWRKVEDCWQWEHPLRRSAWIWLLVKAAYESHNGLRRGQLYFTLSQAQPCWGMTKKQARIFIKRCVEMGDIVWEPGRPGIKASALGTSKGTSRDTSEGTCRGKITLLNYDTYNTPIEVEGTSRGTSRDGSLAPIEKQGKKTKKKKSTPLPPVSHDPDFLKEQLRKLDLPKFHDTYGPQGLNVDKAYEDMERFVLNGNAKKPFPNPANWVDFNLAFHDKCKWCIENNRFMVGGPNSDDSWKAGIK